MTQPPAPVHTVDADHAGKTLAAVLRLWMPDQSWSQVRKLIDIGRVKINREIGRDAARRLKTGDQVEILAHAERVVEVIDQIPIRYIDSHLVVVEKPAGISTVRHPAERDWMEDRRLLTPTLDDLVMRQIGMILPKKKHEPRPRLRIVQRLDKETSGLVVFARTVDAERGLGMQFRKHTVTRRYFTIVPGKVNARTIRSFLVRDRGDGRRGSTTYANQGKEAITHVTVEESLPGYTLLSCRLETGKTHQIRIHLAELGHPVCGDKVYCRRPDASIVADESGAARLALHAVELGFTHPLTEESLHWEMPMPPDMRELLEELRAR